MSEDEISLLKKNVELYIRHFEETFTALNAEDKANFIVDNIRGDGYQIRRWKDSDRYLVVPDDERVPSCRGCFNEFGSCGTPCVMCKEKGVFDKVWDLYMYFPDRFSIYIRKE